MSLINNITSMQTLTAIPQHYAELILEELFASLFHAFIAATDKALATTQTMLSVLDNSDNTWIVMASL